MLALFAEDPNKPLWGFDIRQRTGLASGTIHPILARWQELGCLASEWEDSPEDSAGLHRRQRRYYRMTEYGERLIPLLLNPPGGLK